MWHHTLPSSSSSRYGLPPELGMFVVAPTTSFHPPNPNPDPLISADGVIPNLWQPQQVQQQTLRTINFDQNPLRSGGGGGGATLTCQDCGNQAKKDCSHGRCRTCCKSRGLDCSTHVKSTWVPAARRRERQMMAAGASSGSNSGAKKQRLSQNTATTNSHTSTSNTPPRSFDTSSSHQADADLKDSFPGQVRAPAVFKCVRVTAVDDGEDEFAYQAVVKIGGHVFKGLLYDQGVDPGDIPNLSDLHLGGGGRNGEGLSSPLMEPLPVYGGGYVGGSSYGNTNN